LKQMGKRIFFHFYVNKMAIPADSIKAMQSLLEKDVEMCGYLTEQFIPYINMVGKGQSGQCNVSEYMPMMWHTHPYVSKSYPSVQDIIHVLHKSSRNPKAFTLSIIFTRWGIWELSCTNKKSLDEYSVDNIISELLKKQLDYLYKSSRTNLTPEILQKINLAIVNITNHFSDFKLKIYFTPWQNIQGDYNINW
jgi:hypothetical protein